MPDPNRGRAAHRNSRRAMSRRPARPAPSPSSAAPSRRPVARAAPPPDPAATRLRPDTPLLAVDIGNSDVVVGLFHGEMVHGFWRITSTRATADEIGFWLDALVHGRAGAHEKLGRVRAAVLCSVVPALTRQWGAALERFCGRAPLEVSVASAKGLRIRYRDPSAVGADRIANAIAVRALYGTPAIVVDLGTATTFDCVSRDGDYLGGVIAPGVGTSSEELFRRAARIPRVEMRRPSRAVGRTTEESLRAGVIWGHAGQVDALVRRLALEMKGTPHVIATGGWAGIVAPECETINRVDEALTLKGMRILWQENA
jgi:type III pantothenate kinase